MAQHNKNPDLQCVTLYLQAANYPWSIFVIVNPLTNSKCMEIFFFKSVHYYHLIFQTHSRQSKPLGSWQRANRWLVENILLFFFLITIHKITHLSLPFILVRVLLFLHRIIKNGNHKKYSIAKCLKLRLHIHLEDSCNARTSFSLQQGISPASDLGRWCHQTLTPAKQQLSRSLSHCTWCQPGARLCLELR